MTSSSSSSVSSVTSSLSSSELQAEFLQERRNKFPSLGFDFEDSGVFSSATPPSSPDSSLSGSSSSSPSLCIDGRHARLSLSSPELISELKKSRTRSLRHVPAHKGLTTVFSGRGRGGLTGGAVKSTPLTNQRTLP